jgi:hypothetical protein
LESRSLTLLKSNRYRPAPLSFVEILNEAGSHE